ncbi:MAG: glycogen debranching enzyme family protein [Bryobacterales bacterium]|nr:glycogen debranching enzyme family protein [Bryobacterales bacterium]
MGPIRIGAGVCGDPARALGLEWLETNGVGGFACATITGANTRRYHGLLMAAARPPLGRLLLLSKLEETLVTADGQRYELGVNQYPGVLHPQGYRYLREFRLDPCPVFVYEAGGVRLEKRVFAVHGENTTVVEYACGGACGLELRPLIAFRGYHATTHENGALRREFETGEGFVKLIPYEGLPALYLAHNAGQAGATGEWYRSFQFARERERGLDYEEDLFQPLILRYELAAGDTAVCAASTERRDARQAGQLRAREWARRVAVAAAAPAGEPLARELAVAADQFLVRRGEGYTVIAGYPWFGDWGRDTMVALPGLTLATGRFVMARGILRAYAACASQGMLPNRFPDGGEPPEYNTADAALWFFEAVRAFLHYTGDLGFVREHLYGTLVSMMDWHVRGTRHGIRADADGLLCCGEPGVQLTWMDAKVGDWVVTPRRGKPVEIQALWHNALCVLRDLAAAFKEPERARAMDELAVRARASFQPLFWNAARGCLYDVVGPDGPDTSVRPNQIFAVSLTHPLLEGARAKQVVDLVRRELLTPMGLRTLSPGDPRYCAHYGGGVRERDSAYHQGTVWPWLMGPFVTAYVRVHGHSGEACGEALEWVRAFAGRMREGCLGQVCEVAGGDSPHEAGGCFAQAWSVAELLRVLVEDLGGNGGRKSS